MALGYPSYRSYDPVKDFHTVLTRVNPDIVVIQGGYRHRELIDAALIDQRNTIKYYHSDDVEEPTPNEIKHASHIRYAANSLYMASLCGERNPTVLRPITHLEDFRIADHDGGKYVTFINPVSYKGVDLACELAESQPDTPFMFARTQTYNAYQSSYPKNVKVAGPLKDMREIYSQTKLILAPSQWNETWGRIATEAHASGIPVLASAQGGLPESVGIGGICLPYDAPIHVWQQTLNRFLDDPEFYEHMRKQAFSYSLRNEMRPETIVEAFLGIADSFNRSPK